MDSKRIYGINCDVENCVYNKEGHECEAGKINVCCTCDNPCSCDSTVCKTFKAR